MSCIADFSGIVDTWSVPDPKLGRFRRRCRPFPWAPGSHEQYRARVRLPIDAIFVFAAYISQFFDDLNFFRFMFAVPLYLYHTLLSMIECLVCSTVCLRRLFGQRHQKTVVHVVRRCAGPPELLRRLFLFRSFIVCVPFTQDHNVPHTESNSGSRKNGQKRAFLADK